ncbi:Protein-L-isoaspartate O-methyltransferase [subsurface metagenome]|jgi:protein-L-isoaspartate(D-aspartate) O-methyltransferase|nr:protein-L-isoaspartate(D-aspartate) O-methyltransferase [candidate division WOR-3 bacterium]
MVFLLLFLAVSTDYSLDYKILREQMVYEQIIARGVTDSSVIQAMLNVKRHLFVPKKYQPFAYDDTPLPIPCNQTISQPYIVALMTELLNVKKTHRVLEIGTGSGYQAAILSLLADSVFTIEIICELATSAEKKLNSLGYDNLVVKCGDGFIGWEEYAPFDGIIVTCAPEEIPPPLIEQLAIGGRLVIPVGEYYQNLMLVTKDSTRITKMNIIPVRFVPMTGEH